MDDFDDAEEEEYKYPTLYKTRKLMLQILDGIESLYQELGHLEALEKYTRSNGLKRDTKIIKDTKPDITIKSALQSLIEQQESQIKNSKDSKFREIKSLFISYVELKNEWVVKHNPTYNLLMNFFNENLAIVGSTFDYIMRSIRKPVDDHRLLNLCSIEYIKEKKSLVGYLTN